MRATTTTSTAYSERPTLGVGLRHFTRVLDLSAGELRQLLDLAARMKADPSRWEGVLHGETIACIFEKPSTRTRMSFAAATARLGATPVSLSPQELQLGRGESIADTARSLSGYCAAIVIRTFSQETVLELARWATVPVVNALSDEHHPCQALADVLTIEETFGGVGSRRLAFIGDGGDNVAHSLLEAGALTGLDVTVGCPRQYTPNGEILAAARLAAGSPGAKLEVIHDPLAAVEEADAVYADVWASMGEESEREARVQALAPFQASAELLSHAKSEAIFLHCLPAHRGEEVTPEVIDGPRSVVWQQSANRLVTEEALLVALTRGLAFASAVAR